MGLLVGMTGGGHNVSRTEQVSCQRLEATMPSFTIKFESLNKIKQPEKCSCWSFKSSEGIMVLKKGSKVSSRECVKE